MIFQWVTSCAAIASSISYCGVKLAECSDALFSDHNGVVDKDGSAWRFIIAGRLLLGIRGRFHPTTSHDDVIKWKYFPRYWQFVRVIHWFPVNSPHKGQWRGALMFSLICARINGWVNDREASDLIRHHAHYNVTVMEWKPCRSSPIALHNISVGKQLCCHCVID